MSCAYLAAVHSVICKVRIRKGAVLITYLPVTLDICRVELYLELHIFCNSVQRAAHLIHQHLLRLVCRIYKCRVSVTVISKRLKLVVLQIVRSKPKHAEKNVVFLLLLGYQIHKVALTGKPHVQIPVRCKYDTVVTSLYKVLLRQLVSCDDGIAAVGTALGCHT